LEAAQNEFLTHTLQPYITMIESEFNRKLIKDDRYTINLDETYLLKTDKTAQATYYSTLLSNGVLCVNEVRNDLGLSPIEGGDKHIIAYTKLDDNIINKKQ
jgi:HK97 family phage portal protein